MRREGIAGFQQYVKSVWVSENSVLKAFFQVLTTFLINHGVTISKLSYTGPAEEILNESLHEMVTWGLPQL